MNIFLYNTKTRTKEKFEPQKGRSTISLYVCGPTVYNYPHIGNIRSALIFDLLYRVLKTFYSYSLENSLSVIYARNITDVDDKITKKAREEGKGIKEIASFYEKIYKESLAQLNILSPDREPRATENISDMIAMTEKLIKKNYAYVADEHVLFHVPSYENYGNISRRNLKEMKAGSRIEVADYKKSHHDFIIWKPSRAGEPAWDSPWGPGRPGWHIECSAMALKYLGLPIDIHGGGQDLIFPHHENEACQACAAEGEAVYSRHWIHNAFVRMKDSKMSKSSGNVVLLRDLLNFTPPEAIRFSLLGLHYRAPLLWENALIEQSVKFFNAYYQVLSDTKYYQDSDQSLSHKNSLPRLSVDEYPKDFIDPLLDDLNIAEAVAFLHSLVRKLKNGSKKDTQTLRKLRLDLLRSTSFLGIPQREPEEWFTALKNFSNSFGGKRGGSRNQDQEIELDKNEIDLLIQERDKMRKDKNYARADEIRDILEKAGILIGDTK